MSEAAVENVVETEVVETEKVEKVKKPKKEKATKAVAKEPKPKKEKPAPVVHPKAVKLSDKYAVRRSVRASFAALWHIDGQSGIWQYVHGCGNLDTPDTSKGEVIGDLGNGNHAIFTRDTDTESALKDALGL